MEWPWSKPKEPAVVPPKVGGTRAPDNILHIDFGRPHDFHFHFQYATDGHRVFRRCVVVGYTTPTETQMGDAHERWSGHDRWLVLRQPTGRLVYIPRDALLYIEEPADDEPSRPQ
jgi:hypothetical protein